MAGQAAEARPAAGEASGQGQRQACQAGAAGLRGRGVRELRLRRCGDGLARRNWSATPAGHVKLVETGCVGCCDLGVVVHVMPDNVLYVKVKPKDAQDRRAAPAEGRAGDGAAAAAEPDRPNRSPSPDEMPFFKHQVKIVLENSG